MPQEPHVALTIDEYIAAQPREVQPILEKLRETVLRVAPEAKETISYRIPAFTHDGILVYFAAFKNHIGFYPPVRGDVKLEAAVAPWANEKGNLRFPLAEPIPYRLVERIVRLRLRQNRAKGTASKKRRS
jgi:uncharacterized protein YdhG (YjbR/CyaY superfamily)